MDKEELQAQIDAEEAEEQAELDRQAELDKAGDDDDDGDGEGGEGSGDGDNDGDDGKGEGEDTVPSFMTDDADDDQGGDGDEGKAQEGTIRAIATQRKKKRDAEEKANVLEEENRLLKEQIARGSSHQEIGPRPKIDDYGSDEEYDKAVDTWHDTKARAGAPAAQAVSDQAQETQRHQKKTADAYDSHIDRADALVKEHNIDPATYQQAEESFMEAVIDSGNSPKDQKGSNIPEVYMKEMIRVIGNGSEKVMLHLLANKKAKKEFAALVATDKNGLEVAAWLGAKANELQKDNTRKRSNAKKPAPHNKGDAGANAAKGKGLKKQFDAIKGTDINKALEFRRQARKTGVDVSNWD